MQRLIDNLHRMSNPELIGLAKNRFLPEDVQMAIAKVGYRRAQQYLAENEGLASSVRDYLWSDEVNRGYTLKSTLISSGRYWDNPEKYWELYERYPKMWENSHWRAAQCFLGIWSWRSPGGAATPTELLHEIYHTHFKHSIGNDWMRRTSLERMASHENCDLKLAIMLSTCGIERVHKKAFEKIVQLSR